MYEHVPETISPAASKRTLCDISDIYHGPHSQVRTTLPNNCNRTHFHNTAFERIVVFTVLLEADLTLSVCFGYFRTYVCIAEPGISPLILCFGLGFWWNDNPCKFNMFEICSLINFGSERSGSGIKVMENGRARELDSLSPRFSLLVF